jgi:hypothetical protein
MDPLTFYDKPQMLTVLLSDKNILSYEKKVDDQIIYMNVRADPTPLSIPNGSVVRMFEKYGRPVDVYLLDRFYDKNDIPKCTYTECFKKTIKSQTLITYDKLESKILSTSDLQVSLPLLCEIIIQPGTCIQLCSIPEARHVLTQEEVGILIPESVKIKIQ